MRRRAPAAARGHRAPGRAERWKTMAYDHDMYEGVQRRTLEACCSDSDAVRMEFAKNLRDDVEVCLRDAVSTTVALALLDAREAGVEVNDGMMEAARDVAGAVYGESRRLVAIASVFATEFCRHFLRSGYDEAVEAMAHGASAVAFDRLTKAAGKACAEVSAEELRKLDPEVADLVERVTEALGADGATVFRFGA